MGIRVTQSAVETVVQPTTQRIRVTQNAAEVVVQPTTQKVRVSQLAIEVLIASPNSRGFFAQVIG